MTVEAGAGAAPPLELTFLSVRITAPVTQALPVTLTFQRLEDQAGDPLGLPAPLSVVLAASGFPAGQIAAGLQTAYADTGAPAAALQQAGFRAQDIGLALWAAYGDGHPRVMALPGAQGFGAADLAGVLAGVSGAGEGLVAQELTSMGDTAAAVTAALTAAFGTQNPLALAGAGLGVQDAAGALQPKGAGPASGGGGPGAGRVQRRRPCGGAGGHLWGRRGLRRRDAAGGRLHPARDPGPGPPRGRLQRRRGRRRPGRPLCRRRWRSSGRR